MLVFDHKAVYVTTLTRATFWPTIIGIIITHGQHLWELFDAPHRLLSPTKIPLERVISLHPGQQKCLTFQWPATVWRTNAFLKTILSVSLNTRNTWNKTVQSVVIKFCFQQWTMNFAQIRLILEVPQFQHKWSQQHQRFPISIDGSWVRFKLQSIYYRRNTV